MSDEFLLDTSIVSEALAKVPNARVIERLSARAATCAIAAPVWHELMFCHTRLTHGRRKEAIGEYLLNVVARAFPVLPYDEAAAAWHAVERARLEHVGQPTPFVDGQIAAIAHTRELTLVTRNRKDFARFRELRVEDWSRV